jgi:tRNA threonylcarbamoyladenosine biosynthesis protein TsaB
MYTLYIDTSKMLETEVFLMLKNIKRREIKITRNKSSQIVLPLIEKLLGEEKIVWSDISEIGVNTGPGSFTGLRVGISVANTLGWLMDIKVNGGKSELGLIY